MNVEKLIEAIQTAAAQVDPYGLAPREALRELSAHLRKSGKYEEFDNDCIHAIGTSGSAFTMDEFAQSIVRRATVVGAATALQEVNSYQAADHLHLEQILLLHNIHIDNAFTFSNGVRLVDLEDLPESPLRDSLLRQRWSSQMGWRIDAVLATDFIAKKDIRTQDEDRKTDWSALNEQSRLIKLLDDTRLILSLARPADYGVPALAATTLVPTNLSFLERGLAYNPFAEPHVAFGPEILGIEAQRAGRLISAFDSLNEETQDRLRIALKRLNDVKIDSNWANKAINLRICLENIFLNPEEGSQIARRISERAPEYTSFSKTRARKVYAFLSKAVHTGETQQHPRIDERMIAGEIQNALRQIIDRGAYPVWPDTNRDQKSNL
ncbi:hypothetical protein [Acidimangrovimonas sediminis]|uniref:hypothetical protein n=1 Tax=Acidimangrovimonas sediminis TaxID=2056283 RepID=UPI0011AF5304|nr:hypothetical protein [Acidimangrovimonas sediminis]